MQTNSVQQNLISLIDFSNTVNYNLKFNFILDNLLLTCFAKFKISKGIVFLYNDDKTRLELVSYKGILKNSAHEFRDAMTGSADQITENASKIFNLPIVSQIRYSDIILGYLLIGEKFTKEPFSEDDLSYLDILLNVSSIALQNSISLQKINQINQTLNVKLQQLTSLFELSQEFSLNLNDIQKTYKLLILTIIGQLLVSNYAILEIEGDSFKTINSKFNDIDFNNLVDIEKAKTIDLPISTEYISKHFNELAQIGVKLIIPMQHQAKTRGLILLGDKRTKHDYSDSDIEYISSLSSLATLSLENSRLFNEVVEKQKLEKELTIARDIQQNLLPSRILEIEGIDYFAYNKPSKQVGGDYYDVIKLDEDNFIFAIADVSGKSISASLLMANFQAFLRSITRINFPGVLKATEILNELVSDNVTQNKYITFLWGVYNIKNRNLTYVNAGHNPGLLIKNNNIQTLDKGGLMLGFKGLNIPYDFETIQLEKGDKILLFTDGLTEAFDTEENQYSDEKLSDIFSDLYDSNSKDTVQNIIEDITSFTKGAEQSDDMTVISIKVI